MPPDAAPALENVLTLDQRFERVPMVRQAMILIVPSEGKPARRITVLEIATGGRLEIEVDGIERSVAMNVRELRELAQFCNRIARRAATRPEWKP